MIVLMVLRHDLKLTPRAEVESRRAGVREERGRAGEIASSSQRHESAINLVN